jgi:hypothetical protein
MQDPPPQGDLSGDLAPRVSPKKAIRTGSFTDNMTLPVHRWFRYSAGFSAAWARDLISRAELPAGGLVFDPFAGSGTTLIAAQSLGIRSAGIEQHEFVYRIAKAKLSWPDSGQTLLDEAQQILGLAREHATRRPPLRSPLLNRCYAPDALVRLEALKRAYFQIHDAAAAAELLWLAITSILRDCSGVGTAQWQYLLPNKSKVRVLDPFEAFTEKIKMFCADMAAMAPYGRSHPEPQLVCADARRIDESLDLHGRVHLVLTSPPYPNNYDYADATRLEMTFWGEVERWGDLHDAVRKRLVRSCSQHTAAERLCLEALLQDPGLAPILKEITEVCRTLEVIRETKGGRKTYHTMVAAYFCDLARVWATLRHLCAANARVCFVIGDSAPYGVYVPVDRWLGELAIAAGFVSYAFEKSRDRNTKWKNRKHRVPLKEGSLWVRG